MYHTSEGIFAITEIISCVTLPSKYTPLVVTARAKDVYKDSLKF